MSDKSQTTIDQELAAYKMLGSLDQRDAVATSELSNVIDALRSDLSIKLDCETGNPIVSGSVKTLSGIQTSGDIEIHDHSIKILSGNYIQTDDALGYVQNYSAKNSFLQAECSEKYHDRYGIACTGARGYCILSINIQQRYIRLSGDLAQLIEFHNLSSNAQFSISFGSGAYSQELKIDDIVQDNAEWGHIITDISTKIGNQTSAACIDNWENDDNAFYCPKAPDVGNTAIPAFYGSHAEGAATKAIQRCTHAEGRNTLADIRYSHAEGSDTIAAQMYSHAEGNATSALGRAAHSEGDHTCASGIASHTSGVKANAKENFAFAWSGLSGSAYNSNGVGTFNVNPIGGLSGFYIGQTSLASHFSGLSSKVSTDYALKSEARSMSAYALQQAGSYTDTVSSNLSTALISTVSTVSSQTLVSAHSHANVTSAYALDGAKEYADGISAKLSTQIENLDVNNTLSAGKILTSLSQTDGKVSYQTKTLEISDVNGLQANLDSSSKKFSILQSNLWSALSSISRYESVSAVSLNEVLSAMFDLAKALKEASTS